MGKKYIGISLILFFFPSWALADQSQALQALKVGNYQQAAVLWQQMANAGDPLAQYNLALLYKAGSGVRQDKNMSEYWLRMAARQGLAQAYTRLNTQSLAPTKKTSITKVTLNPEQWIASQNPKFYTLQLASSTNQRLIAKYFEQNALEGKAGYYRSMREGEQWYALVYGAFSSVHEAKAAIDALPADLRKWSPWVRNIKSIHRIMIR